jgi:hypothetical protein
VPAWASYRALERPLRATSRTRTRPTIVLAVVCIVAPILAIGVAKPLRSWATKEAATHFRIVAEGEIDQAGNAPACFSVKPLSRRPAGACTFHTGSPRTVTLVGDSNAAMFGNALIGATESNGSSLQIAAAPGCVFADLHYQIPWDPAHGKIANQCRTFAAGTLDALAADPPDVVVIAGSFDQDIYKVALEFQGPDGEFTADVGAKERIFVDGLTRAVERLQAAGSRVVLVDVVPKPYELDPRECSNLAVIVDTQRCLPGPFTLQSRVEMAKSNRLVSEVAERTGATVWNFSDEICPDRTCVAYRNGYQVWRDPVHISAQMSTDLEPKTIRLLQAEFDRPATGSATTR